MLRRRRRKRTLLAATPCLDLTHSRNWRTDFNIPGHRLPSLPEKKTTKIKFYFQKSAYWHSKTSVSPHILKCNGNVPAGVFKVRPRRERAHFGGKKRKEQAKSPCIFRVVLGRKGRVIGAAFSSFPSLFLSQYRMERNAKATVVALCYSLFFSAQHKQNRKPGK